VVDRADLRELVDDLREPGQVLGDAESGLARGDRLELAADTVGRIGLHVEGVDVRRAAELVQEDDVPGPRLPPFVRLLRRAQKRGEVQAKEARRTGLDQAPPREAASPLVIGATQVHEPVLSGVFYPEGGCTTEPRVAAGAPWGFNAAAGIPCC
jgi:hypothetical protein